MSPESHPRRSPSTVIGVGASAGGVEAITELVGRLPADLDAALLVVLHVSSTGTSVLPKIIARATELRVVEPRDGERLEAGTIYVAPPDRHLLVRAGAIELSHGPKVNGHRPAIDPTFKAIAREHGRAGIGVILSGTLDDGSRGAYEIDTAGGCVLLQDPTEARHSGMITSAKRYANVSSTFTVARLADELIRRTTQQSGMQEPSDATDAGRQESTSPTRYTCPDCGGGLWRETEGPSLRYTCSVGHEYSPASLDELQGKTVETALWAAVRILGDRETLLTELANRADESGRSIGAAHFRDSATEMSTSGSVIRELIERGGFGVTSDPDHAGDPGA